jgi:hypothetical protein
LLSSIASPGQALSISLSLEIGFPPPSHKDLKQGNGALPERGRLGSPEQNSSRHNQGGMVRTHKSASWPLGA